MNLLLQVNAQQHSNYARWFVACVCGSKKIGKDFIRGRRVFVVPGNL